VERPAPFVDRLGIGPSNEALVSGDRTTHIRAQADWSEFAHYESRSCSDQASQVGLVSGRASLLTTDFTQTTFRELTLESTGSVLLGANVPGFHLYEDDAELSATATIPVRVDIINASATLIAEPKTTFLTVTGRLRGTASVEGVSTRRRFITAALGWRYEFTGSLSVPVPVQPLPVFLREAPLLRVSLIMPSVPTSTKVPTPTGGYTTTNLIRVSPVMGIPPEEVVSYLDSVTPVSVQDLLRISVIMDTLVLDANGRPV
jgi:hypothetical protein